MTDRQRIHLMVRCAALIRHMMEQNGGRYDGMAVPNIQSVIDLGTADEAHLVGAEATLTTLERAAGIVRYE